MISENPTVREIVLIGAGHSHILFLRKWGMQPLPGVQVTLISPSPKTVYTGMLPGYIAGHYRRDQIFVDLVKLCRYAQASFVIGSVEKVSGANKSVCVNGRPKISYDILSIDIGVTSRPEFPIADKIAAVSVKPFEDFTNFWDDLKLKVLKSQSNVKLVIVGGGVGAAEIALAIEHSTKDYQKNHRVQIRLLDRSSVFNGVSSVTRRKILKSLKKRDIQVYENVKIEQITMDSVLFKDRHPMKCDFVIFCAGAKPYDWLKRSDLALKDGFIKVDRTLCSLIFPEVFAVGDCAHLCFTPRPKSGVFAVRQAPILYSNIKAKLLKKKLVRYKPQKHHLKLISLGSKTALLDYLFLSFTGGLFWKFKDLIDRKFMNKFLQLPIMEHTQRANSSEVNYLTENYTPQVICGGCGAKVESDVLSQVLNNIEVVEKQGIVAGIGDDAAVIRLNGKAQIITTDNLRLFNSDLWRVSKISAIHALGDIWAMGGDPKYVTANIIIPDASSKIKKSWLNQIMQSAHSVFRQEGAMIVGGHTSLGAEFNIGFSITATSDRRPVLISGAKPGDHLLLTKPIGSGTILAGEMQLLADGDWVSNALQWMERSQKDASEILSDANAMTDVTGFGLAGHLMRILESSKLSATIDLREIPFLDGSENLSASGVRSSIFSENSKIKSRMTFVNSPKFDLLFDPQTAGGLLATLPEARLSKVLPELSKKGYCSAIIGRLNDGEPFIRVI